MGNYNFEVTIGSEMMEARKRVVCLIKEKFVYQNEVFEVTKNFFEKLSRIYNSALEKRQPSNEHTFLRISGSLPVMSELLETMGSKLSLLQHEIQFLDTNIDLTTENRIHMFQDSAERGANIVEEISKKIAESFDLEADLLEELRSIYES